MQREHNIKQSQLATSFTAQPILDTSEFSHNYVLHWGTSNGISMWLPFYKLISTSSTKASELFNETKEKLNTLQ